MEADKLSKLYMTTNGLYAMIYPTFINENMHIMHTILDIQSGIQCKNTFSHIFFSFCVFFLFVLFYFLKSKPPLHIISIQNAIQQKTKKLESYWQISYNLAEDEKIPDGAEGRIPWH